jgi:hypothetical protein
MYSAKSCRIDQRRVNSKTELAFGCLGIVGKRKKEILTL